MPYKTLCVLLWVSVTYRAGQELTVCVCVCVAGGCWRCVVSWRRCWPGCWQTLRWKWRRLSWSLSTSSVRWERFIFWSETNVKHLIKSDYSSALHLYVSEQSRRYLPIGEWLMWVSFDIQCGQKKAARSEFKYLLIFFLCLFSSLFFCTCALKFMFRSWTK